MRDIRYLFRYSLNAVGVISVGTLVALILLAFVAHGATSKNHRRWLLACLPAAIAVASAFCEGSPVFDLFDPGNYRRPYPEGPDYAAAYVLLAFGFGFAIQCFRIRRLWFLVNGMASTWFFGALIVSEFLRRVLLLGRFAWSELTFNSPEVIAILIYTALWGWVVWLQTRRFPLLIEHFNGECSHCGYDLRGNPKAMTCPECGEPVSSTASAHQ